MGFSFAERNALVAWKTREARTTRDARLNRDVAVKVLPDAFADDAERVTRFEREAQVLAAVNHPHIAAIDGHRGARHHPRDRRGRHSADRLDAGRLPLDEAVPIAIQIAEALEAAHEKRLNRSGAWRMRGRIPSSGISRTVRPLSQSGIPKRPPPTMGDETACVRTDRGCAIRVSSSDRW
jgi:serine/threonine protein kinase